MQLVLGSIIQLERIHKCNKFLPSANKTNQPLFLQGLCVGEGDLHGFGNMPGVDLVGGGLCGGGDVVMTSCVFNSCWNTDFETVCRARELDVVLLLELVEIAESFLDFCIFKDGFVLCQ